MKKKKQIKILCDESIRQVAHNFVLRKENDELRNENTRLRDEMDKAIINFSNLKYENQKLKIENDLARMQLQDAQEKMRKPVFIPID